jgi:hypothetical protein
MINALTFAAAEQNDKRSEARLNIELLGERGLRGHPLPTLPPRSSFSPSTSGGRVELYLPAYVSYGPVVPRSLPAALQGPGWTGWMSALRRSSECQTPLFEP